MKWTDRIQANAKEKNLKPKPTPFVQRCAPELLSRIDAIAEKSKTSRNRLINSLLEDGVHRLENDASGSTSRSKK